MLHSSSSSFSERSEQQKGKVLLVGPGLVGWNVLDLLLQEGYSVTAYLRRQDAADELQAVSGSLGNLETVLGDLDDTDKITSLAVSYDIIFHCATADHKPSVLAILEGIRERKKGGKRTFYLHTSGTSVLADNEKGERLTAQIFYDTDRAAIDSVPDDAPHRPVDLAIMQAAREFGNSAKLAIVMPPLIYGLNKRHKRLSIQIITLTRFALKHGFAGWVGTGAGAKSQIHAIDLARAYIVLLHHMESDPPTSNYFYENPYFFCENGREVNWTDAAHEIGKALHEAGKITSPEPREIPEEMYGDLFGKYTRTSVGYSTRSRAVRLRELGWQPREKDIWDSYRDDELPVLLEQGIEGFSGYLKKVSQ